ncbi:OLC1v1013639C1 [Oldenlandia corymbosa var. corymbosa]|uniref:OLC1v1013639C1 n=1 Tax=Oldenlandia corymbosa var. corymbosa TaxID=529605 RepID=A0AAV1DYW3_OLDCO|nr:OLC1v1013639C1 [Oldenlandia corymbosa var. corymbosa]
MTEQKNIIDPRTGFCPETKIYHSLRPPVTLPPASQPLSIAEYTLSLLQSTISAPDSTTNLATPFLIDAATGEHLTYATLLTQIRSLSVSIQSQFPSIAKNDVAFILAPPSLHIPVLYLSLLSLGITVSPANPLSTNAELAHLLRLCKPSVIFTALSISSKLPPSFQSKTILIDSPQFLSMITGGNENWGKNYTSGVVVNQNDSAAILYSSGTTGKVKGVEVSHRNLIAVVAGMYYNRYVREGEESTHPVSLFPLPLFHVFGFFMLIRGAAAGETLILMKRFDFVDMLKAVEKYKVTYMPVSPPLVVAMAKSDLVDKYDLSSLKLLGSGGAPLGREATEKFLARFPHMEIFQGYGMTETGGAATRMLGADEAKRFGSVGRLTENIEAKIVDPDTKEALPPGQRGELWLRGPIVMKGYVGDPQATAETMDPEGWLKTGDLCYFDSDGFLFIVDRLKELIKYKAYQVPPAELEHLLQAHPDVADVAVIPYPDEEAGQIPMAYIVRKPGRSVTEAQIMEFTAKQVFYIVKDLLFLRNNRLMWIFYMVFDSNSPFFSK